MSALKSRCSLTDLKKIERDQKKIERDQRLRDERDQRWREYLEKSLSLRGSKAFPAREWRFWERKTTLKQIERGQKLRKLLLDKRMPLEKAMKKVGVKTESCACDSLRVYMGAVKYNIDLDLIAAGAIYAITPCDEVTVFEALRRIQPRPIQMFVYGRALSVVDDEEEEDDERG